jgi:hypothetical protein
MLGRRRNQKEAGPPPATRNRPDPAALGQAINQVLAAFLSEAPADNGFVFNIAPVTGGEQQMLQGQAPPLRTNMEVPVPGVGMVSQAALAATMTRLEGLATRLGVDPTLSQPPSAEESATALARLDSIHAGGELTDQQYQAVRTLIHVATPPM